MPAQEKNGRGRASAHTYPYRPQNHSDGCAVTQSRMVTSPTIPPNCRDVMCGMMSATCGANERTNTAHALASS